MVWVYAEQDAGLLNELWADSAHLSDETLSVLLSIARTAVEAYAPALAFPEDAPPTYRVAQILQARHVWATASSGGEGSFGPDGYMLTASSWPLVMAARDLVRPKRHPFLSIRGA